MSGLSGRTARKVGTTSQLPASRKTGTGIGVGLQDVGQDRPSGTMPQVSQPSAATGQVPEQSKPTPQFLGNRPMGISGNMQAFGSFGGGKFGFGGGRFGKMGAGSGIQDVGIDGKPQFLRQRPFAPFL